MDFDKPTNPGEAKPADGPASSPYKDGLDVRRSDSDLKRAMRCKGKLISLEREDFEFALGKQWDPDDVEALKAAGAKPITDNRVQPNVHLLTGLERQNRPDLKAFPEGEEDSLKAEIATALLRHAAKASGFRFKNSEQFKDGVMCGESHLEMYLEYDTDPVNGRPCWRKYDGADVFADPDSREYDYSDARYVYKITRGLSRDDLRALFPGKEDLIGSLVPAEVSPEDGGAHVQPKDYKQGSGPGYDGAYKDECFDLVERYYKKWVERAFVGDRATGRVEEAESPERAREFVEGFRQRAEAEAAEAAQALQLAGPSSPPATPQPQDPGRFSVITKQVPEIWCAAHTPGAREFLSDEPAWSWPEWRGYPCVPFHARFSTAPLEEGDRHMLVQGVVRGVKDVQKVHNKSETLLLRHLNSSTNSGWLSEEDAWVDAQKVRELGTAPGVNLEYKKGYVKPERIFPGPLSTGHATQAERSAEAIKAQLGINADLLAVQEGGGDSGRAIALRQRQGLLMVQEIFDNLSRTRQIAARLMLSQLGRMYDTARAVRVLGEAFLAKNFPPPTELVPDPATGLPAGERPVADPETGAPMAYDRQMAEVAIAEVLAGRLWEYDVEVGESVSSETQRMANAAEVDAIAQKYPGLVPPDVIVEASQLPAELKTKILNAMRQAQAAAQQAASQAQAQAPRAQSPNGEEQ